MKYGSTATHSLGIALAGASLTPEVKARAPIEFTGEYRHAIQQVPPFYRAPDLALVMPRRPDAVPSLSVARTESGEHHEKTTYHSLLKFGRHLLASLCGVAAYALNIVRCTRPERRGESKWKTAVAAVIRESDSFYPGNRILWTATCLNNLAFCGLGVSFALNQGKSLQGHVMPLLFGVCSLVVVRTALRNARNASEELAPGATLRQELHALRQGILSDYRSMGVLSKTGVALTCVGLAALLVSAGAQISNLCSAHPISVSTLTAWNYFGLACSTGTRIIGTALTLREFWRAVQPELRSAAIGFPSVLANLFWTSASMVNLSILSRPYGAEAIPTFVYFTQNLFFMVVGYYFWRVWKQQTSSLRTQAD